ncbi:STAS domain-containing protein [Nocardia sp. NRRL S-836]|uniref:STAS domain-containing protein n=1 Tax=Nocardia sp. NRRL S-836 TaxID=1519492 RepID=UPI0006AE714F|nr:STAS domain-containing protein [Nocardia sp. NRRL S-836]KOV85296.1 hypothetical protein ADL03_14115 [Nocardia sp. NRRL S-836]
MTEPFRLDVRAAGAGRAVIAIAGELDPATAPRLREQGLSLLTGGSPHLLLDMSGVDFCDSSGLSVVIGLWQQAHAGGGSLTLAAVPDRLTRLLRMTGTDSLIPVQHADSFSADQA